MLDNNGVHQITYTAKTAQKAYKEAEQEFKFELEEPQKVVDYFGMKLVVPNDNGWIATDSDGLIRWYHMEPKPPYEEAEYWGSQFMTFVDIGILVSMPSPNWWKESLIEV